MAAPAAAVIFTFTAVKPAKEPEPDEIVCGAWANVAVCPAAGTVAGKFSSPKVMVETEVLLFFTVTVAAPVIPLPSAAVAVIAAVPGATPVTMPAEGSIRAMAGGELVHVTP